MSEACTAPEPIPPTFSGSTHCPLSFLSTVPSLASSLLNPLYPLVSILTSLPPAVPPGFLLSLQPDSLEEQFLHLVSVARALLSPCLASSPVPTPAELLQVNCESPSLTSTVLPHLTSSLRAPSPRTAPGFCRPPVTLRFPPAALAIPSHFSSFLSTPFLNVGVLPVSILGSLCFSYCLSVCSFPAFGDVSARTLKFVCLAGAL